MKKEMDYVECLRIFNFIGEKIRDKRSTQYNQVFNFEINTRNYC